MTREEKLKILKGDAPAQPTREEALATLKGESAKGKPNPMSWTNLLPEGGVKDFLAKMDEYPMALSQGAAKSIASTPGIPGSLMEMAGSLEASTPLGKQIKVALQNQPLPTMQSITERLPTQEYEGAPSVVERIGEFLAPVPGGKGKAAKAVAEATPGVVKRLTSTGTEAAKTIDNYAKGGRELAAAIGAGVGSKAGEALGGEMDPSGATGDWLGMAGSVAGTIAGRGRKANPVKIAAKDAPTEQQLATTTEEAFNKIKDVSLNKAGFEKSLEAMARQAKKDGVKPGDTDLFNMLNDLRQRRTLTFDEVLSIRQRAGREARNFNPANPHAAKAAGLIANHLDDYFDIAAPQNPRFAQQVKDAKELGRSSALTGDLKEVRRGGDYSQMGEAIGEMNRVRAYATNRKGRSFSPVESEAIKQAVGRNARSPVRIIGRGMQGYLTQGVGIGTSAAQQSVTPMLISAALGGVGRGMEKWADAKTLKKLDDIMAAIRAGRPTQAEALITAGKRNAESSAVTKKGLINALRVGELNRGQE